MDADEFSGLYAIIPTPAKEGADSWDAKNTVDVEESARLVELLVTDGVSGIIALGTTGECATLSPKDYETMVRCVTESVAGRIPTYIGATALGTHDVVGRLRLVSEAGATGSLVGLPMWQPLRLEMAVKYFEDLSYAFPDLDLMVYANRRAFRYEFSPDFWEQIARRAPTVVAAKISRVEELPKLIDLTHGRIRFIPNESKYIEYKAVDFGSRPVCWATAASMGPQPILRLLEHSEAGNSQLALESNASIRWAHEPVADIIADQELFASYNIQLEKIRISAAGYCSPGPIRPPYAFTPEDIVKKASENGRRWRELVDSA